MEDVKSTLLRITGRLVAVALGCLGVLSGCDPPDAPTYGVSGVFISGRTLSLSAADSARITGIQIRLTSADSTQGYSADTTDSNGFYYMYMGTEYFPWPDSVRLIATDIDGPLHGSFAGRDSVLDLTAMEEEDDLLDLVIDLYLEETGE